MELELEVDALTSQVLHHNEDDDGPHHRDDDQNHAFILLVEDDIKLAENLQTEFIHKGFAVDLAHNGVDGEFMGDEEAYDMVVLDLGLPERPGLEVLANWRKKAIAYR